MDPKLFEAATTGNLSLLQQAFGAYNPTQLEQFLLAKTTDTQENIFHIATDNNQQHFINQVILLIQQNLPLPAQKILSLLCQQNITYSNYNPLHIAASEGHFEIVRIFIETYYKFSNLIQETRVVVEDEDEDPAAKMFSPPWLARARSGATPLFMAIKARHEQVATYILSQDLERQSNMVDFDGKSPLYLALENGLHGIAVQILESNCSYSIGRTYNNQSLIHNASGITERVALILLEKHPEFLTATDLRGETFLHEWVFRGELTSLQCFLKSNVFTKWSKDYKYLLCFRNKFGDSPLHRNINKNRLEILTLLIETYCQLLTPNISEELPWLHQNYQGDTLLHLAIQQKIEEVALYLISLDHTLTYIPTYYGKSPLFAAVESGSAKIATQIISKCPYPFTPALYGGPKGQNPFHVASKCPGIVGILIERLGLDLIDNKDVDGKAPLYYAAQAGDIELITIALNHSGINSSPKAWIEACKGGHMHALRKFMEKCDFREIYSKQRDTPLHHIQLKTKDEYQELLNIHLMAYLKNVPDKDGATPLHRAIERKDFVFIELLLECQDIDLNIEDRDKLAQCWIDVCEGGNLYLLQKFMEKCDFRKIFIEQRDTPLHHMQLKSKEEYQELLDIPLMAQLKNALDSNRSTPLHRAIQREDMVFVEVLLGTKGIDYTKKDNQGQTAMYLLAKLCDEHSDWEAMCKHIRINPRIKTKYIPQNTNLAEIRTTLSVVAALLATITFAAGFTIPGGFNNDGYVILAKKAAFIVFLLSDTYAMCCSMLVLFCLIWAMVCDDDVSHVLIDRSVFILQQSLYGTLVAFMAGVYTVVSHDCLWTAIVVCVMCSLVAIVANKSVLYKLINRFIPSTA